MNYHSFYQFLGVGLARGARQKEVSTTHSSSHLCQHPQASVSGERALMLTVAQRLVSTLKRPLVNARNSQGSGQGEVGSSKTTSPVTAAGQQSDTHRPPSTRGLGNHSPKAMGPAVLEWDMNGSC